MFKKSFFRETNFEFILLEQMFEFMCTNLLFHVIIGTHDLTIVSNSTTLNRRKVWIILKFLPNNHKINTWKILIEKRGKSGYNEIKKEKLVIK